MEIRYANHPNEVKRFDTTDLREQFLIEELFVPGELLVSYSHVDRIIIGGAVPVSELIKLEVDSTVIGANTFLERREIGIINVGGQGTVTVDGKVYTMNCRDCLYVGRGAVDVSFESDDAQQPAKFYLNSTPAHQTYPTMKIAISEASPIRLGSQLNSNERTIYRYIHQGGIQSCQLVMGMTLLQPGSMWNTMPCHTHNRRSEVYFYFDMPDDGVVFHLMGEPTETRHVVVRNEQAVISPSWSIHSGVGTSSYSFIWGMAGENQTFEDMDPVAMRDLK
ncbi:5-dehydro-4-deoxy-D-glucuronate isomerase [Paenibacillus silvisoli]|uniref:5-dehydro-4-deoxy-D-glucuronate isomerase n=1 Tax=Paenibacillus silvisoli TaxID=3110539 RepID=UPI00280546C8|nr:5-dehydro-4-deoxy-D-glucuronate isomerase [Paenibacillus silvisoli]